MTKAALIAVLLAATSAVGQQPRFKWLNTVSDRAVFEQIRRAFSSELTPDRYDPQSHVAAMKVKFIDQVGLVGNSALVMIAEKQEQADPDAVLRAFSFDFRTGAKSPVRAENVEWFWLWRVEKIAHLTPTDDTDIIFQFDDCLGCEAETLLASFRYDATHNVWEMRDWGGEKSLMVDSDRQFGDDGIYYYDCLHIVGDLTGDGLDDVAIRCRESVDRRLLRGFSSKPIPRNRHNEVVLKDETALYAFQGGRFQRIVLRKGEELNRVHGALCATQPASPLSNSDVGILH